MKSVLITGVCGGVGQALAFRLREEGWAVYGTDIEGCSPGLNLTGFLQGNIAEEVFWRDTLAPELSTLGELKGFVHNAAIQPCSRILDTSLADWNQTMEVNLSAAFLGTRYLAPLMRGKNAAIVNVSSVHSMATSAGMSAYVASKGGLLAFTRAAALELVDLQIRVNAVLPGAVDTSMLERGLERGAGSPSKAKEALISRTPLKKLVAPDDVARAIAFLLDGSQSSLITGQTLVVDGGVLAMLASE
jgi:NAD(P)-dependent dehydrogenase (short-subunit alcohol dehydrogenase family)